MPYQIVALVTAFVGSAIAAIWDLKTTEIPDKVPYAMIAIALLAYGVQSYIESNYWFIANSIIAGLSLLGFGFLLYYSGQWGGGDAKLLSAIGFLLPITPAGFAEILLPLPEFLSFLGVYKFPIVFTFNLFLIGAVYMIGYSVIMAARNRKIVKKFLDDAKSYKNKLLFMAAGIFVLFTTFSWFWLDAFGLSLDARLIATNFILSVSIASLILLFVFAKAVEEIGFRRKIPISKLRVGDVPMDFKVWEGITEKQLRKIKNSGKKQIWIKDGVRFAPSFVFALAFTLYFGNAILSFFIFVL